MKLTERLASEWRPHDRERGRQYFTEGRVRIVEASDSGAFALVRGSRQYSVLVDGSRAKRKGLVSASCTCPRFEDGIWCKHVWATLLALDASGARFLTGAARSRELTLEFDEVEEFDEFDELDEEEFDEFDELDYQESSGWRGEMDSLESWMASRAGPPQGERPGERELLFGIDYDASRMRGALVVRFYERKRKKNGEWGKAKWRKLGSTEVAALADPAERQLADVLVPLGVSESFVLTRGYWGEVRVNVAAVPASLHRIVLPRLCESGKLHWANALDAGDDSGSLVWDDGPPFHLTLKLERAGRTRALTLEGTLCRGDEVRALSEALLLLPSGLALFSDRVAPVEPTSDAAWASFVQIRPPVKVPEKDAPRFVERLMNLPQPTKLLLPPELAVETKRVRPTPWASFLRPDRDDSSVSAKVHFDYQGKSIDPGEARRAFFDGGAWILRDEAYERDRLNLLAELGFEREGAPHPFWSVEARRFAQIAVRLIQEGFVVMAEGRRLRTPGATRFRLASGIDWLELEGEIDFGGETVEAARILESLARGQSFVRLSDGSEGILPEEWLARAGVLEALSPEREGNVLRFRPAHALLLDALLEAEKQYRPEESFVRLRDRLRSVSGLEPLPEPPSFRGKLRGYQREGHAWLSFLAEYGFGGCLADDMGLGKTIQVLAFLESRRASGAASKPSLVVAPRSVVHNWIEEAARFVPGLPVLDYSGGGRSKDVFAKSAGRVVVTTYGILRRDFAVLGDVELDTVVLDEAQAIKNEKSQAAKASRLLRARNRLALSGTPIENHLGELWSLFEFLNPGMLGRLLRSGNGSPRIPTDLLARALRPFILRRTKEQVLSDLPQKNEQTLSCPLEGRQLSLYEELRRHYQKSLRDRIEHAGLSRSKIWVIEALLRLRQAACHPRLLDRSAGDDGSAKLDALVPRLQEVVDEGHKALVFSQFTTFLAIVRRRLDKEGLAYEYLDGRTRDRKTRVDRFQTDPSCPIFLVSLKAGGLGLNLTAADYVFILDPWWNPAVEAQAVDRAHRIGQTRPVFAYRLIAKDTVEEKILELQGKKRALADAILSQNNSVIRNLTLEDLELLLG